MIDQKPIKMHAWVEDDRAEGLGRLTRDTPTATPLNVVFDHMDHYHRKILRGKGFDTLHHGYFEIVDRWDEIQFGSRLYGQRSNAPARSRSDGWGEGSGNRGFRIARTDK